MQPPGNTIQHQTSQQHIRLSTSTTNLYFLLIALARYKYGRMGTSSFMAGMNFPSRNSLVCIFSNFRFCKQSLRKFHCWPRIAYLLSKQCALQAYLPINILKTIYFWKAYIMKFQILACLIYFLQIYTMQPPEWFLAGDKWHVFCKLL